jgi:hypothetical protein
MCKAMLIAAALSGIMVGTSYAAAPSTKAIAILKGHQLFDQCDGFRARNVPSDDFGRFQFCEGYIVGIADTLSGLKAICPPSGVSAHQYVGVATNYLRDYPENRHYAAAGLVALALKEKFSCN